MYVGVGDRNSIKPKPKNPGFLKRRCVLECTVLKEKEEIIRRKEKYNMVRARIRNCETLEKIILWKLS